MQHRRDLFKLTQIDIGEIQSLIASTLVDKSFFKAARKFFKLLNRLPETIDGVFDNPEFAPLLQEIGKNHGTNQGVKRELFKIKVDEIADATIGPYFNPDIQASLRSWLCKQYSRSAVIKDNPYGLYVQTLEDFKNGCLKPRDEYLRHET